MINNGWKFLICRDKRRVGPKFHSELEQCAVFLRAEISRCREYRSNGMTASSGWLLRRLTTATAPCTIIHSRAAWNFPSVRGCCAIPSAPFLRVRSKGKHHALLQESYDKSSPPRLSNNNTENKIIATAARDSLNCVCVIINFQSTFRGECQRKEFQGIYRLMKKRGKKIVRNVARRSKDEMFLRLSEPHFTCLS